MEMRVRQANKQNKAKLQLPLQQKKAPQQTAWSINSLSVWFQHQKFCSMWKTFCCNQFDPDIPASPTLKLDFQEATDHVRCLQMPICNEVAQLLISTKKKTCNIPSFLLGECNEGSLLIVAQPPRDCNGSHNAGKQQLPPAPHRHDLLWWGSSSEKKQPPQPRPEFDGERRSCQQSWNLSAKSESPLIETVAI